VLSRSVRDTAASLDVLQGPEPHAPYFMPAPPRSYLEAASEPLRPLRIGFSSASPLGTDVHPEARQAVEQAARLLESLGHHVEEAAPGVDGVQLSQDFLLSWFACQAAIVDDIIERHGASASDFEPDTRAMASVGRSVGGPELVRSQGRWNEHVHALSRFHQRFDFWLSPALSAPPIRIGEMETPRSLQLINELASGLRLSGFLRHTPQFKQVTIQNLAWTPYTQLANITGRPAMSVPLHWTADGLPLGVQFTGALDSEFKLLQLAFQLEAAQPWFARRPLD
jgi:amidase